MRMILVALPCLLFSGLVLAKDAPKAKPAPKAADAAQAAQPTDTSKRFNMTQNGKRMTADDFDAWMKKNGYRVATGAPAAQAQEEAPSKSGGK
jgi:hypothetical protein